MPKGLCFRARLSANVVIIKKMIFFYSHSNDTHFYNDFALKYIFVLKVLVFGTQKFRNVILLCLHVFRNKDVNLG